MRYTVDKCLSDFEFWGGAEDNAAQFTNSELDSLGDALDGEYAGGPPTETEVNDLMRFEPGTLARLIGLEWDDEGCTVLRGGGE